MLELIFAFLKQSGVIILILFIVFALYMYLNQNNIIYVTETYGIKTPSSNPHPYQNPNQLEMEYKNVYIKTNDNLQLHGWLVYKKNKSPNKTLIYFHENAGNIGFRLPFVKYILTDLGFNCLIVGYRGYGHSQGTPSEKGLQIDGESIAKWAFNNEQEIIDKNNIFLFGRSLGGAVAAHVAVKCNLPFKGIIIENTFSSMGDMVDNLYPILKYIRWMMLKSKWETIKIIGEIKYPILFFRSEKDELIPKKQMDSLFEAATGAKFKDYCVIKDGSHNEGFLHDRQGYKQNFLKFVEDCDKREPDLQSNETKKDK